MNKRTTNKLLDIGFFWMPILLANLLAAAWISGLMFDKGPQLIIYFQEVSLVGRWLTGLIGSYWGWAAVTLLLLLLVPWLVWLLMAYLRSRRRSSLPWYLVIGSPNSGKNLLLQHAGALATFPLDTDAFIIDHGVLLEGLGLFIFYDDEGDQVTWPSFLAQVTRLLQWQTLHGVVTTMTPDQVVDTEAATQIGLRMRRYIDDLGAKIGIVPPLYLVATHCEALDGFKPFFGDLTTLEQEKPWGATFVAQDQDNLAQAWAVETRNLYATLRQRRLTRLFATHENLKAPVYTFPARVRDFCQHLQAVGVAIVEGETSVTHPNLRGFYLTGIVTAGNEEHSYFIHDLFAKIVSSDVSLAQPTRLVSRRHWVLRAGLALCGFCAALVFIYLYTLR